MNPLRAGDARRDLDRDGLSNLGEYRLGSGLRDEDSDNDGHDDGDEVKDGVRATQLLDADTDTDGVLDGEDRTPTATASTTRTRTTTTGSASSRPTIRPPAC